MLYAENAVIGAPLAGYTDVPFRRSLRRHGARALFTEMVDAESLLVVSRKQLRYIDLDENETETAIQLVCAIPEVMPRAAERVADLPFFCIDFNLGCPAPKVAKKGEGARLARENPALALACVRALVQGAKNRPVTCKMRILSETDPEKTVRFAQELEACGIAALTLHGRVAEKFYSGMVFTDIIRAVAENVSIPVIANGGVMDAPSAADLREKSGCSRIMVARGCIGNPWIFDALLNQKPRPNCAEFADEIRAYLEDMMAYYGVALGLKIARKTILGFLKGSGYGGQLRAKISFLSTVEECAELDTLLRAGPKSDIQNKLC